MGIHRRRCLPGGSCVYVFCTLALLFGGGLAALYSDKKGQPEMQQAMDNSPLPQDSSYPIVLTQKTSTLLSEALKMLRKMKDVRERMWVEAFIHRIGNLAADLEESSSTHIPKEMQEPLLQPFDVKMSSIPSSPTSPAASKLNKAQARYQVTSAQVNDVLPANEGHMNRQVVTKPSLLAAKAVDDLVLQLHNQEGSSSSSRMKSAFIPSDARNTKPLESRVRQHSAAATPPTTSLNSGKSKLREIIQAEIDALKHRRETETEKDARNSPNNQHVADFTNPDFVFDQKQKLLAEDDEFEIEEDQGAAAGELEEDEEPPQNTVSSPWQKVLAAEKAGTRLTDPAAQQYPPGKEILRSEPTMSAEMERQLRAGKIVVLSDSLVKTNFRSKENNDNAEETFATQSIPPSRSPVTNKSERRISNRLPQNNNSREDK